VFVNRGSEGKILWFEVGRSAQDEQIRVVRVGALAREAAPLSRSASIFPQSTGDCNQGLT